MEGTSLDIVPATPENVGNQLDTIAFRGPLSPREVADLRVVLEQNGPGAAVKAMGERLQPFLDAEDAARDAAARTAL